MDNIYNSLNSWSNQLRSNREYGDKNVGHKRRNSSSYASYGYDANGNLTYDGSKYLTTTYNHLNLPSTMRISGKGTITTIYDATGRKWQKKSTTGEIRDYISGLEFVNGRFEALYHSEGRVVYTSSSYKYEFSLKDHLGNTRATVDESGQILQESHYYPFGMLQDGQSSKQIGTVNRYQYNGKEFNDDFGLDWSDYGARWYDASLGRWNAVDPLAEEMTSWSPYNYVFGNPIKLVDPDGRAPDDWVKREDGSIYWDKNATSQATIKDYETYLGKNLTFTFNSYIDANLWDGPMGDAPAGVKLTTTVSLSASENAAGELTGLSATKNVAIGPTPVGTGRDYFPGLGAGQNSASATSSTNTDGTLNSYSLSLEQHASVSPIEQIGLNLMGYDIVNVAQSLQLNYSGGNLSVTAGTDVFPSATLSVNGNQLFKYNQPSFTGTHGRNKSFSDNGRGGVDVNATPRRPAPSFYTRYKN